MKYFKEYPIINYNNELCRNIVLRPAVVESVFDKIDSFYNYIVPEGYRIDMVANEVYGDPYYSWLVCLCNNIVDPYYDWPLEYNNFYAYLQAKYNTDVFTLQSQILHYKYVGITGESPEQVASINWTMTPETHAVLAVEDPTSLTGWSPVYTYDYEDQLNDAKRSIRLISKAYLPQINKEFTELFK